MAKYKYLITDKYGKEKKGTMEAVSEEAAMRKLKGEGSIVLEPVSYTHLTLPTKA